MIVGQVTSLTHAHRVELPVGVRTFGGILVPTKLSVTRGAHVFGVMLSVGMRALCNLHGSLRSRGEQAFQVSHIIRISVVFLVIHNYRLLFLGGLIVTLLSQLCQIIETLVRHGGRVGLA